MLPTDPRDSRRPRLTLDALQDVSPLLAARSGMTTAGDLPERGVVGPAVAATAEGDCGARPSGSRPVLPVLLQLAVARVCIRASGHRILLPRRRGYSVKRTVAVLGVAGVLLAGCGAGSTQTVTATVLVPVTVTAGAEPAAETPSETASTAALAAGAGTRANPVPVGSSATVGDWTVSFAPPAADAADQIAAENQFNEPAPAGKEFVMSKVTATYNGAGSETAWIDLRIVFVGVGGNTFGSGTDDRCGVLPESLSNAGEVFTGATASGNECAVVTSDQVAGGSWSVTAGFSSDPVFFAAQ